MAKFQGRKSEDEVEDVRLKRHPLRKAKSPSQIYQYIDDNVIDLESAKEVLKTLAMMVILSR
tara:strand:+ start:471 stop:656 length:186 start_codon:yes stop_codon:yes gene_type:complete